MRQAIDQSRRPILSLIIPTRERGRYIGGAIKSALACADPEIEIIVSDNASMDNTAAVVASLPDTRLIYINTGERVPMTDNFELGLSQSTGRYVLFIGDDDAVVPNGIARLLKLLRSSAPEAVNWQSLFYEWPTDATSQRGGQLLIKPRDIRGGDRVLEARSILQDFAACRVKGYRDGANIYHGCVSRDIVDRVKARIGRYFFTPWPDVSSSIVNLFEVGKLTILGYPCSIGGVSPASTGASLHASKVSVTNPLATFVAENNATASRFVLDSRLLSLKAITYFNFLDARRRLGAVADHMVDNERWSAAIVSEIAALPQPARDEQAAIANAMFTGFGLPTVNLDHLVTRPAKRKFAGTPITTHRLLPNRISLASGPSFCDDIALAAKLADAIMGDVPAAKSRSLPKLAIDWTAALGRAASAIASSRQTAANRKRAGTP